jgi:hypothetical protein
VKNIDYGLNRVKHKKDEHFWRLGTLALPLQPKTKIRKYDAVRMAVVYSRSPRKKQENERKSICTLHVAGHSFQCLPYNIQPS